jgi:hypothetical protein
VVMLVAAHGERMLVRVRQPVVRED